GKFELTVSLTRAMFPYLVMVSVVALTMGALNAYRHFAISAASPAIFNIISTATMALLVLLLTQNVWVAVVVVLLGGISQVVLQGYALHRAGLLVMPKFRLTPEIKRILWLMAPALAALAVYQINLVVLR